MVKEVIIHYNADSEGNLKLFEVLKSDFNMSEYDAPVKAHPDYNLYTDTTLWLNFKMYTPVRYGIFRILDEKTLLECVKRWDKYLKEQGYTLTVIKNNKSSEIGIL